MVFPVVGGTQSTGYDIDNSVRFNRGDGADLSRAPSADGNRKTWTFSTWVKLGNIPWDESQDFDIFSANSTNNFNDNLRFDANGKLTLLSKVSGDTANGVKGSSTRLFRDPSAWYHIVVALDTTQATNSNGFKMYVNGVQETISFNNYNQNISTSFNKDGSTMSIGHRQNDGGNHYDGYVSETHFIDGTQLDASYFGETNDNGVWIPKKYTGSYGTNGFFFEYQQTGTSANSSGIGADTSGNDNHFTPTNLAATDITVDTPTNNFATLNGLAVTNSDSVLSEGNTVHTVTGGNAWIGAYTTLGAASGKWYAEVKILDVDNNSFGVIQSGGDTVANINTDNSGYIGKYADGWGWWGNGNAAQILNNNSNTDYGVAESVNDIFMIAVDIDGGKIWVGKNGTWFNAPGTSNVGDPANGNNPGVSSISFTDFVHFASGNEAADSDDAAVGWNFGNAAHSISSGNADANGYGNFEYAVPSGFYALCTKNLAEYG